MNNFDPESHDFRDYELCNDYLCHYSRAESLRSSSTSLGASGLVPGWKWDDCGKLTGAGPIVLKNWNYNIFSFNAVFTEILRNRCVYK